MSRFYITTPIYYVNDVPHIGHAYTTIAADVLARWYRLQGDEVFFLTGTDEHGTKIAQAATAHNRAPQEYCDEVAAQFQQAWKDLHISNDSFVRTTSPAHARTVQAFLKVLWDKGVIYKARYQGKYCVQCERFYAEDELIGGLCPDHRIPPEVQSEDNYFFRLSQFRESLLAAITDESHPQHLKIYPLQRRNEVIGKLKQDVNDLRISRATLSWGIPLPWDRSQTTYVWVDALLNYLTAIGYPDDTPHSELWWPADLHLMAKDILWFHAVIWPALLMAAEMKLPKKIFVHGFFTVNGQKMSKSMGNVIRPAELIKEFGVDGTRFLLLSAFPFGADGDFNQELMTTNYNASLANDLGNLISRSFTMVENFCAGKMPPEDGKDRVKTRVFDELKKVHEHLDRLQFHFALTSIISAVELLNGFIEEQAPWKLAKTSPLEGQSVLREVMVCIKMILFYLWPFMSDTAQTVWRQLGQTDDLIASAKRFFDQEGLAAASAALDLPAGQPTQKGTPLFPRK
jgi:methionyl-tRNA synthetase